MKVMRLAVLALAVLSALALPMLAFAASPEFGAVTLEVTPNTKHAFTSAKTDTSDTTQIQPSNWNAAHLAPAYQACRSIPLVWESQPTGITEFGGTTSQRCRVNLTYATSVRIVVQVLVAGAATSVIRAQYSIDSGSTWAYLDGSAGPSVSAATTGVVASTVVSLATAAKADVLIRFVGLAP